MKLVAELYLVHCLNRLKLHCKAEKYLHDGMVTILSHGSLLQRGVMFLLLARTIRLKVNKEITDVEIKQKELLTALNYLDKALIFFQNGNMVSKLLDVHLEFALLYNDLGYIEKRNESSTYFRVLSES